MYTLGIALNTFHRMTNLILTIVLCGKLYCSPKFTDKETKMGRM